MLQKIFINIIFIILIGFSPILLTADKKIYEYSKDSILKSEEDKHIYDTQSADYTFEYGIELLRAGMYEESLDKFQTLRFNFPNSVLSSMSYIYDGIALVKMSKEYNTPNKLMKALDKLDTIINNHLDFIINPSEDLVQFYILLSKNLRSIDSPDFRVKGYLEYSINFFAKDTKDDMYTEIGYLEYLRGNFVSSLNAFKEAKTFDAYIGRAKTYSAMGSIDDAIRICSKLKHVVNGDRWEKANKLLSYYKSLKNAEDADGSTSSPDKNYLVNTEGNKLNGNYRIYLGTFTDESKAKKEEQKAEKILGIEFITTNDDDGIFKTYSDNVYKYNPVKIKMELLLNTGNTKAFIKDISY